MLNSIPIYVINLKRSPDRLEFMVQQLNHMGLTYKVIDAIDGRLLTKKQKNLYSKFLSFYYQRRELADNEIGCALSHYKTYENIIHERNPFSLVLEDDCIITKDLFDIIDEILNTKLRFDLINSSFALEKNY